jgi:hypothetical protein
MYESRPVTKGGTEIRRVVDSPDSLTVKGPARTALGTMENDTRLYPANYIVSYLAQPCLALRNPARKYLAEFSQVSKSVVFFVTLRGGLCYSGARAIGEIPHGRSVGRFVDP